MSDRFRLVLLVVTLVNLLGVVRLIHRKRLSLNYSLLWLLMLLALLVMVLFPQTVYAMTRALGIELPINMLFTGFAFFTLVMLLYLTCIVSRDNARARTMAQEMALLEKRVRELERRLEAAREPQRGPEA